MADIADRAQAAEELHQRLSLERLQREIASGQGLKAAENCRGCGDPIPEARQEAVPGTQHCTPCASAREVRSRQYRAA